MKSCVNQACPNYPPSSEVPYKKGLSTDVLLIVDQPTLTDTYIKELLAGEPGEYLQYVFDKTGIKKGAFWIASAARCHFDKQLLSVKQVNSILKCCGEKLHKLIKLIKPKLVIATGELAAKQFGKSVGGVKRNRGLVKSVGEDYPAVLITYSPSYCVVNPSYQVEFERDIALAKSYIDNGFELNVIEPVVEQVEDLESVLPDNLQTIAIDTETQGLDWLDPNSLLISFSICFNRSHAYQVVLQQWADDVSQADYFITTTQKEYRTKVETCIPIKRAVNYEKNLKLLRDLIENPNIKKYMFNGQFDLCFIARECEKTFNHKLQIKNFAMDVQALAHALDENLFSRASLESVRKRFSNFNSQYSVTFDTNFDKNNVILIPKDELCSYAALDAYTTFISGLGAKEALLSEAKSLQNYFIRFVMPTLSYALPTLTMNGGYIDKAAIPSVKDEVAQLIQKTHKEAIDLIPYRIKKDLAPHMLRLSRNALVRDTLFHKDGFNIKATNPTKGGVLPSVGSEARTYLKGAKIPENAVQFIEKYEQWSMLNVLLTRYIKAFETSIRSDGRIHPTYSIVVASTGRSSTSNPSFQNLPKRSETAKIIRRLIVPEDGNILLSIDYSQCLVPETELITIDGIRMLSEVIEQKLPVLSLDSNYNFEFKDVLNGWPTGENEVFKISLEDGSQVIATANHKFYDYYGNVKLLSDLRVGDRLLHARINYYSKDYPEFTLGRKKSKTLGSQLNRRVHNCVANYLRASGYASGSVIHHKDHNKNNWVRDNILLFESQADHFKECHSNGDVNSNYGKKSGVTKKCPVCDSVFYRPLSKSSQITCSKSCGDVLFPPARRTLAYRQKLTNNHKIISIEPYGRRLTYQIEVVDNHNYVLSNGLVSKNCELRWMAHLSQDETMRQVYREDGDIHTKTALAILGKPREEVSDAELKPARRSAKCFHPDTEVLTKEGWVSFKNLKPNIEVMQAVKNGTSIDLEWSKPLYFKLEPNHTDSLVSIRSENINLKVTPDHQMLVQRQNGNFDKVSIDSFVKARSFWNAGYYSSSNCSNLEERIIRLAVATQADGSYFPHGIRFGFYKTRKVERLLGLLENGEYNIAEHKNGKNRPVTAITLKGPIVDNIKSLLNLDKTFNWNMLNWSLSDRLIVIDELKYWDSFYHKNGKFINYSSTAKINCDVIQALCAISGWKTKLRVDVSDRYSTGCIYNLHLKDSPKSRGLSSGKLASYELNSEPYTGDVAVISMPSDIILVRSHEGDGRQIPLICHQCMNFGLLYGMSTMGFQRYSKISYDIDLTFDEAASFINLFFSTYPGIQKYHRSVINFARKNGYVQSPFGRKRRLPGINSNMPGEAARCERQALNHAIQSAASDMALIALNEILKNGILDPKEAKPIMFVHDELVFEIKETRLDYYAPLIQYQMENPPLKKLFGVEFAIPIKTDAQIGYNYADLSSYTAKDEDNK